MTFIEARAVSQSVPKAHEYPVTADEAFHKGALLLELVDGELVEAAADPDAGTVKYVAQGEYGVSDPANDGNFRFGLGFPPGKCVVTEAMATSFRAEYVGTLPDDVGGQYGVVRSSDGKWRVDFADTTNVVVQLLGPAVADRLPAVTVRQVEVRFIAAEEVES